MYKLLIADDNKMHIQCVLDYVDWKKLGFTEIKTASNGKEAFKIFNTFKPDLVITDVVMPKEDGIILAKNIRSIDKNVHIVFMSCYEEFEYAKHAIDNDITAYVLKPIEPAVMQEAVNKVVTKLKEERSRSNFLSDLLYSDDLAPAEEMLNGACFCSIQHAVVCKYVILSESISHGALLEVLASVDKSFEDFNPHATVEFPNKLIILLITSEEDGEVFLNRVLEAVHCHMHVLKEDQGLSVVVGVSSVYPSVADVSQMLRQASMALDSTYSFKPDEIYFFENFEEDTQWAEATNYTMTELKADLSFLLEMADAESIEVFLNKYYPHNAVYNKNSVKALCFSTVTNLQLLLSERSLNMADLFENPDVIWEKLNKFDTIQDTYHWLKNILTAACEFVTASQPKAGNDIVGELKSYIDTNFKDITSLKQIAADLYISTGYARNIFKKQTGQTIFDYLVDRRIAEAKKLLRDPSYKVYEIVSLVGYTSKAHFIETFKRKTGMTPSEYRQLKMQ
ncbi:MAG: response regulator [Ruminococcaceae bacterium]|nr:response regulator [Oscillospiraceae bacterium]